MRMRIAMSAEDDLITIQPKQLFIVVLSAFVLSACEPEAIHVAGPFYLTYFETRDQMSLFRCPDGPSGGCAIDGLPDETVFAAGGNTRFVVIARHPRKSIHTDRGRVEYFYFLRIKNERKGWGEKPEKIVGPLSQAQFEAAKMRYDLPDFSIRIKDLE